MKIKKTLKYADFEWDEGERAFTITEQDGNRVILNKAYAFAFMRFVVRVAQRNWLRNKSANKDQSVDFTIEEETINPKQSEFHYEDLV